MNGGNTVDALIQQFHSASAGWSSVMLPAAQSIFWTLALISLVLSLGLIVVTGRADFGAFVAAVVRWVVCTGIAYWALLGGPQFAGYIIDSFRQLGGQASGFGKDLSPTLFLGASFDLYQKIIAQSSIWHLADAIGAELIGIVVVGCCAWVTANVILSLCAAWVLSNAGVIFLSMGASVLGSDIAIDFWRHVVAAGVRLMVMELILGIGYAFLQSAVNASGATPNGSALVVILGASLVLALLSNALPNMLASVVGVHGANGIGNLGAAFGVATGMAAGTAAAKGVGATAQAMAPSPVQQAIQSAQAAVANGNGATNANRANGANAAGSNRGVRP